MPREVVYHNFFCPLKRAIPDKKSPANKGGAKVSVIRAIPLVEGAVTLAVFEFRK